MEQNLYPYAPHDFMINYMIRHPEVALAEDKYSNTKRMKKPVRFCIEDISEKNYFVDNPTYIIGASNNKLYQVRVSPDPLQGIQKEDITHKHHYKWKNQDGDDAILKKVAQDYENSLEYDLDRIMRNLKSSGLQRHLLPITSPQIELGEDKTTFTGRNSNSHTYEMCIIDFEIVIKEQDIEIILTPQEEEIKKSIIITRSPQKIDQSAKRSLEYTRKYNNDQDYEEISQWIIENMQQLEVLSRQAYDKYFDDYYGY